MTPEHRQKLSDAAKRAWERRKAGQPAPALPVPKLPWRPAAEVENLYRDLAAKVGDYAAKKLVEDHMRIKRIGPYAASGA